MKNSGDRQIPRWRGGGEARLSFDQERLWCIEQVSPGTPLYNVPIAWNVAGPLDVAVLQQAFDHVVARHEALRTSFRDADGEPVQVVSSDGPRLELVDASNADGDSAALEEMLVRESNQPFDLEAAPLVRATLFRLSDDRHIFSFTPHHIVFDGWSCRLLIEELCECYGALLRQKPPRLPELPLQYRDYAEWQRSSLTPDRSAELAQYWRKALAGLPILDLPGATPRPDVRSSDGREIRVVLPKQLFTRTEAFARESGVTLFAVLLAAYGVLLHRFSHTDEVVVACPMTTRRRLELAELIGFFVNTLPIRIGFAVGASFVDVVKSVQGTLLDADEHSDLPFQEIVKCVGATRAGYLTPLFQTMLTYEDARAFGGRSGDVVFTPVPVPHHAALTDLVFACTAGEEDFAVTLTYSTDICGETAARRLLDHFAPILTSAVADPSTPVDRLSLLTDDEQARLRGWNETAAAGAGVSSVQEMFEQQAARTPDAVAVLLPAMRGREGAKGPRAPLQVTYGELNSRANRLAATLRLLGVGRDAPVGLCVERSVDALVGLLGILKAGGAYVPLDPAYPARRLDYMLKESGAAVLLAHGPPAELAPTFDGRIVRLDDEAEESPADPAENPEATTSPDDLAYVIFTSGSTGKPKGVAMPHRPLINLLEWQGRTSDAAREDRTLQFTPLSFDVSFQEVFSTWCTGGTLVLIPDDLRRDPLSLVEYIVDHDVKRLFLPFVGLQCLCEAAVSEGPMPACLREVITAGEQLQVTPSLVRMFTALPDCRLWNHYGPTEAHVVTAHLLDGPPERWPRLPPIGRPISNVTIHVLDANGQAVPIGEAGELHIGGCALARGYLGQPELTAERFVCMPAGNTAGERLYKTGDNARYLPDGRIEFLGRGDAQVKIRGFRVEPGEVESALVTLEDVSQAAVVLERSGAGDPCLVAHVVPAGQARITATDLRTRLREELPNYMIPQHILVHETLPLSPSGKLDRAALPGITTAVVEEPASYEPPSTETERLVARIWQEVLGVERVGLRDNFFDLGGHSLLAIKVVAMLKKETGARVTPHKILFSTLAQLAAECGSPAAREKPTSLFGKIFGRGG